MNARAIAIIIAAGLAAACAPSAEERPTAATPELLQGKRIRYLIGADGPGEGAADTFTVVSYSATRPAARGLSGAYVNLLVEGGSPNRYAPYLRPTETARRYGEGVPNPAGPGFELNLRDQLARRRAQGFSIVGDLDNPDAFSCTAVARAYDVAAEFGMSVVAKNPGLGCAQSNGGEARTRRAVIGLIRRAVAIIVERGAGDPSDMDELRTAAGRDAMQVWFVFFGTGSGAAAATARQIASRGFRNMSVTYSSRGEYGSSEDVR